MIVIFCDASAPALAAARMLMARRLPGLQEILEVGTQGGRGCVVLDALARVPRAGKLPARSLDFAARLAAGLAALHAAGLVHGRIGPEQVEWTPRGEPRLTLAGLLGAPGGRDPDPEAERSDVDALLALLQQWAGGGGAAALLREHPEGRPYRTAQELADALQEPRARGTPARAIPLTVMAPLAALIALIVLATRSHEPIVERIRDSADPAEEVAALPPPLEVRGRQFDGARASADDLLFPEPASPWSGAEPAEAGAVAGRWRCETAGTTSFAVFHPGGSASSLVRSFDQMGQSRDLDCSGTWIETGPGQLSVSMRCIERTAVSGRDSVVRGVVRLRDPLSLDFTGEDGGVTRCRQVIE